MPQVVLVTGVSRPLGVRLVRRLLAAAEHDETIGAVVGIDTAPPEAELAGQFTFIQADIRSARIGRILRRTEANTVVHLDVTGVPSHTHRRAIAKEVNVIGTMQLLAACQRAPSVRKLVVRSSTAVYGCSPSDPAMFTETAEPTDAPYGYGKDATDVEGYLHGFARRRTDVTLTVLRLANVLSGSIPTPLAAYFSQPVVPTVIGYDARLQFVHPRDAANVLYQATLHDHPGVFNVAGPGIVLLSQAVRRAGRIALPLPRAIASLASSLTQVELSEEQLQFLTYGRGVDTTRLRETFGYEPEFSTIDTLDAFVRESGLTKIIDTDRLASLEKRIIGSTRSSP